MNKIITLLLVFSLSGLYSQRYNRESKMFVAKKENLLSKDTPFSGKFSFDEEEWVVDYKRWSVFFIPPFIVFPFTTKHSSTTKDNFSRSLQYNFTSGKLKSTENESIKIELNENTIVLTRDEDVYKCDKNGTLNELENHGYYNTTNYKFENQKLTEIKTEKEDKRIILKGNELKILKFTYSEGNKNKTQIDESAVFENFELKEFKRFDEGRLKEEKQLKDGLLNSSISKGGYDYGNIQNNYEDGLLTYSEVKYSSEDEYNYDKGYYDTITNTVKNHYVNGLLTKIEKYKNGVLVGIIEKHYSDLQTEELLESELVKESVELIENNSITKYSLVKGLIVGEYIKYEKDNKDRILVKCNYNPNGRLEGKYIKREYEENEITREESGEFKNGEREGKWMETYMYGYNKTVISSQYVNGFLDGPYKTNTYDKTNKCVYYEKGNYVKGEQKGNWESMYYTKGKRKITKNNYD